MRCMILFALTLTSCMEPCQDQQCQINRAMMLGVILQQQNQPQYYAPPQRVFISTCDSLSAIAHNC